MFMLSNYAKTAFRFLQRNKTYTIVNSAGLSVGIAICITLFFIIRFELSFDRFHAKEDRIYRIISKYQEPTGPAYGAGVPAPLPVALRQDFPQIQQVAAIYSANSVQFQVRDSISKMFKEENGVFYLEPAFFEIFDFTWITGGPAASLSEPNSIVLTKDIAQKYFGSWNTAIGKTLQQGGNELKVTGILDNVPPNTDFQFKCLISYSTLKGNNLLDWETINSSTMCYVLLPPDVSPASINSLLPAFLKKYKPIQNAYVGNLLQPLSEVHFDTQTSNFLRRTVSRKIITLLELIGVFILIIACVNFINLSTAQSLNRAREIGVRKVLGSSKMNLKVQFYIETGLIVLASILVSLLLVQGSLPYINTLLQLPLYFNAADIELYLFLFVLFLAVVFLASFYPALVLSGFNVIAALKSKLQIKSTSGVGLRKGLIVTQFVIAQILIIGTVVSFRQMRYFQTTSMGFTKESIIKVPFPGDSVSLARLSGLKNSLIASSNIENVSFSFSSPAEKGSWQSEFTYAGNAKPTDFAANLKWADDNYLKTYDLKIIAGKNYRQSDSAREVIVSEELVKKLGLANAEDILNKEISFWDRKLNLTVVGVIKNFHSQSLHEPISPVIIGNKKESYRVANIRLNPDNINAGIVHVEKLWNTTFPETTFDYSFVNDTVAGFYMQEQQLTYLFEIFAGIAIFLSCLGLYGLVSFMAIQRRKEVGIRKVLGASVQNILLLFSKEFIILIVIAFVVATPIAFYVMNNWMQDFAYRSELSWWLFALGGGLTLIIAMITIGFQAVKTALSNPTENIKTE